MSDRKYRQRGYQDQPDDRSRERRAGPGPRPPGPPGPRGRGLGKPTASVFRCAVCGHRQTPGMKPEAKCEGCGTDLHTCTHCAHFDPSATHECRQPIVEPIRGKARRNDCDLFAPKVAQEIAQDSGPKDPRAAFDALFKNL